MDIIRFIPVFLFLQTRVLSRASLSTSKSENKIRWFVRLRNNELFRITYISVVWNLLRFGRKIRQITIHLVREKLDCRQFHYSNHKEEILDSSNLKRAIGICARTNCVLDHIKKGILFSLIQGCGVAYGWSSLGSDSIDPAPRPP